jgi:hypothetical protein
MYNVRLIGLSLAAGLVCYLAAALVALVVQSLRQDKAAGEPGSRRWTSVFRSRYVLFLFPIGFAVGFYLILDRELAVSVYWRFVVPYAVFWGLVSLLFLVGAPVRHKLLSLGLLAVIMVSARFVHWDSRKPFLKDLFRVKEGMTVAQVEQIMGGYMTGGGIPVGAPAPQLCGRLAEYGPQATGTIVYRHTNEGWGDSDWGVVALREGRVVDVEFSPD